MSNVRPIMAGDLVERDAQVFAGWDSPTVSVPIVQRGGVLSVDGDRLNVQWYDDPRGQFETVEARSVRVTRLEDL